MEMTGVRQDKAFVVTVNGRLDTLTAPEFEKTLNQWIDQGESHFIVDLKGLEYISSAGLRSILLVGKRLRAQKGSMAFCAMTPVVSKVFAISNFAALFPLCDSVEKAIQEL